MWAATLASFCDEVASAQPAPAAVTVSCVTAEMGIGLLVKVLTIVGRRKSFKGDRDRLNALTAAAGEASAALRTAAADDVAAVRAFIGSREAAAALRAIEVPMQAARAAANGLDLCGDAKGLIEGLAAADLEAASLLISAALRAIVLSVEFNLRLLDPLGSFAVRIRSETQELIARVHPRM
jgi:formiminotetrahydrofolate cyclodeaminase